MVTTGQAAPAVRLNGDWQAKYRQRAQQFLLSAHHKHEAGDCKVQSEAPHLPQQQQPSGDCASSSSAAGDEEVQLETLDLQQVAISTGDGEILSEKGSVFGEEELHIPYQQNQEALSGNGEPLSVCIVGRSGVGKGSLINHLLQERAAEISHFVKGDDEECSFDYYGLFRIRGIPGYDGWHSVDSPSRRERLFRRFHDSSHSSHSHSSGHGSSSAKRKQLTLDEFVQIYGLFEAETKAIIFVVNSRITPDDHKLMELAIANRKFFCIVCTHADNILQIADNELLNCKLEELEEQLRKDLSLIQRLNVRVFILSIPFPEGQKTGEKLKDQDLECVMKNTENLHFPLLKAYLSKPRGLLDELQIQGFVKEEVWKVLAPFQTMKKRHQALSFTKHLVAGTFLPILGPLMVSFIEMLCYTLKACFEVGLIEDVDDAMEKVTADAKKHKLSTKVASKEALVTAVHDSIIHIFGEMVFEIAIAEVVITVAETALTGGVPLVAPIITAALLPSRFKKIAEKLGAKACMLHELWVMQNITGLLGIAHQ